MNFTYLKTSVGVKQAYRFFLFLKIIGEGVLNMLRDRTIKYKDYERAAQLLGELFEADSDITEQISSCIQCHGIERFFENLETFDFSVDIFEKLNAVRHVLFGIGERVGVQEVKYHIGIQKQNCMKGGVNSEKQV